MTAGSAAGPDELLAPLLDVARPLSDLPPMASRGDRDGWAEVVRSCQAVVNAATALQDEAMVRLVAIEPFVLDDGTIAESHRAPGHVALDAPALVASALEVSQVHAERRVRAAVRLAADGPAGTTTCTGLGALHDAMRAGRLDGYRAGVVAHELEEAPPEVAETVVASLGDHLDRETAPQLRRRCRRLLARISPDLLRHRGDPGPRGVRTAPLGGRAGGRPVGGELPQRGRRSRLGRHRHPRPSARRRRDVRTRRPRPGQALIDLVMESATVTTIITLTVPAAADAPSAGQASSAPADAVASWADPARAGRDGEFVEVTTGRGTEPVLVPTSWIGGLVATAHGNRGAGVELRVRECDALTGALLDAGTTDAYRPPESLAQLVRQRDGRCRFPGCSVAARFCDLDHVRPWPFGPTAADNLVCLCRRHHRVKQRPDWRADLTPDGVLRWTEPTGRVRTTLPVDALHAVVLPARPPEGVAATTTTGPTRRVVDETFSHVEFGLEHLLGDSLPTRAPRSGPVRDLRIVGGYEVHSAPRSTGCRAGRTTRPRRRRHDPP